jgi:hypothetical protein
LAKGRSGPAKIGLTRLSLLQEGVIMKRLKEFSLSYYYDALKRKQGRQNARQAERGGSSIKDKSIPAEAVTAVLKTLKGADDQTLDFSILAKRAKLSYGECEEVIGQLKDEGLVGVTKSEETDKIFLTI